MRVQIVLDSATPQEVYTYTLAYQRTKGLLELPPQRHEEPMVTVCGSAMGWTSPHITHEHAAALLNEAMRLEAGIFDHQACAGNPCPRCIRAGVNT